MDMSIQTSLSSVAWGRRFLSASVVALLLISVLAFAIPLAPVAHAAVATPTVSMDHPYMKADDYSSDPRRTITVANPVGNPGITRIELQVPKEVVDVDATAGGKPSGNYPSVHGFINPDTPVTAGSGPWVITYAGRPAGAVILPGGAAGKITVSFDPPDSVTTSGVVDTYTLTVTCYFEGGASASATITLYVGEAGSLTLSAPTSAKAGDSIPLSVNLDVPCQGIPLKFVRVSPTTLPSGFTDSFTPATVTTGASAAPAATATYTTTYAASYTLKATVGVLDTSPGASNGEGILEGTASISVSPAAPTKVSVSVPGEDPAKPIHYITTTRVKGITLSLADAYGNPVAPGVASEFSLTASLGSISIGKGTKVPIANTQTSTPITIATQGTYPNSYIAVSSASVLSGGSLSPATYYYVVTALNNNGETAIQPAASQPTGTTTSVNQKIQFTFSEVEGAVKYRIYRKTDSAITAGDTSVVVLEFTPTTLPAIVTYSAGTYTVTDDGSVTFSPGTAPTADTATWVDFTPYQVYGSLAVITATLTVPSGTYAGTYSGTSRSLVTSTFAASVTVTAAATSVEAGKTVKITAQLPAASAQKGVPITFSLVDYSTGYAGTLSTTSATTDDAGKAEVVLTVDTKAGAYTKVRATVAKPTTANPANTFYSDSPTITTVAGAPIKLLVKTYEYVASPPASLAALTPKSSVAKGGKLYIAVQLSDAYGNPSPNNLGVSLQISLTATAGGLSTTTAMISTGATNTWESTPAYYIVYTAPATAGTVTITATTPQGLTAGSATITVLALEPTVVITQPAADTTINTDTDTATVTIAGYATVSPGQPTGTAITEFKYSLNGAANVTVPIASVTEGKYNFQFTLTLQAGTINTITVYTKDSQGYEGSATRKITVTKQMQPVFPAEIKTPTLVDTTGRTVTAPRAGAIVAIASPIVNKLNTPQPTLYIVQVKDSTGAIVSFNFVSGTIPPNTELTFAIGWRPAAPGTYTIEVFAWNNFTEAQVLAPMQTITVTVT